MNKKKFDCVKMKWDIQRKLEKEFKGITDCEINKRCMNNVFHNNKILGPFIHKIRKSKIEGKLN